MAAFSFTNIFPTRINHKKFMFLFFCSLLQMRSYTHDIEKLQKEVDLLQKQNEELKQELNMAKDQIIELETNAMEVN